MKRRSVVCLMVAMLIGSATPALARKPSWYNVKDIGHRKVAGFSIVSMKKEEAIGTQYAQRLDQSLPLIKDPVVQEFINRMAQNIALHSDAKFPVTMKVINRPTINAFTLPGGYIFMNSGTILAVKNQAELAAVMSHEIGHVSERSWASETTKKEITEYAMLPLMFTPMGLGEYYIINGVMSTGLPITFLKFSRDQEEGADFLGTEYLWNTGYDPHAMVWMFGIILKRYRSDPSSLAQIYMTHPPTPDRIIAVEKEIKRLPKRSHYLINTSEFVAIQQRLRRELRTKFRRGGYGNRPTLERRNPPGVPPPPGTQRHGNNSNSGNQPPVLGKPTKN